jgi:hypothetical protein
MQKGLNGSITFDEIKGIVERATKAGDELRKQIVG